MLVWSYDGLRNDHLNSKNQFFIIKWPLATHHWLRCVSNASYCILEVNLHHHVALVRWTKVLRRDIIASKMQFFTKKLQKISQVFVFAVFEIPMLSKCCYLVLRPHFHHPRRLFDIERRSMLFFWPLEFHHFAIFLANISIVLFLIDHILYRSNGGRHRILRLLKYYMRHFQIAAIILWVPPSV